MFGKKEVFKRSIWVLLLLMLLGLIVGCAPKSPASPAAPAQEAPAPAAPKELTEAEKKAAAMEEAASFYKGKIIKYIVPYDPGGGYDAISRTLAPYLQKYTGATVVIDNRPGGGGMLGLNELYRSRPDGLTIGILNAVACVTNTLAGIEGIRFEFAEFGWLGRIGTDPRVLAMRMDFPYRTFGEMLNAPEQVTIGATGLGGSTYVDAVITAKAFNLKQNLIHGYDSSSQIDLGMLRGEVDGMWGSYASRIPMLEAQEQFVILQSGKERHPDLPDVPTWFEFAATEEAKAVITVLEATHAVGRPVAAPPGVPEERLMYLREAFYQAVHDPGFIEEMTKAGRTIEYLSGEDMTELAKQSLIMPDQIKEIFVKAIKGDI